MFHNILVVVDGSTDAELALTHAITLAEYSHSRLTLFTAVEQRPPAAYWGLAAPGMIGFVDEPRHGPTRSPVAPATGSQTTCRSPPWSRAARSSQPWCARSTDGHHDLIVMGHRGHDARWSAMRRTVSDYLLRHTAVPLLIIRAESSRRDESPDFDQADYAPVPRQRTSRVEPQNTTGRRGELVS